MGKSLKNSVTPDEMYDQFGADTLRLYEMFMGPLDQDSPWETKSVVGSLRLLQRVWRNLVNEETGALQVADERKRLLELKRLLHQTIHSVREDMENLRFNTAIARITELNNEITKSNTETPREVADALIHLHHLSLMSLKNYGRCLEMTLVLFTPLSRSQILLFW